MLDVKINARQTIGRLAPAKLVQGPYQDFMKTVGLQMQGEARTRAKPHSGDTGETARSIQIELPRPGTPLAQQIVRVFTLAPQAWALEKGRTSSRMPPSDAISDWLRRHGRDPTLGFVVARAIARKGTQGIHFMERAADAVRKAVPGLLNDLARDIEGKFRGR